MCVGGVSLNSLAPPRRAGLCGSYAKRNTGHYTFSALHGLAIDGIRGGALRFMNHCLGGQVWDRKFRV